MMQDNNQDLLPPLPSFSGQEAEPADEAQGGTPLAPITISDEEFYAALKGEVPPAKSALNLAKAAEMIAAAHGDTSPGAAAAVASDMPTDVLDEATLRCYCEAAALRYTYLLDTLTPTQPGPGAEPPPRYRDLGPQDRDAVFACVTGRSEIVLSVRGEARWLLRDDERRAALKSLLDKQVLARAVEQARQDAAAEAQAIASSRAAAQPDLAAAPEESPDGANRVEELLWRCLSGSPPPLESLDRRELIIYQRVAGWLSGLPLGASLPSPEEIGQQLARETLLQPFRHLTGEWKDGTFVSYFTGRDEELNRLYEYLAVFPPASMRTRLARVGKALSSTWYAITGAPATYPLLIYGPGGVGKSTLLAKLLLDHLTETRPEERFPYAYLDFDLSALNPHEPLTLLVEMARQLAIQYPLSRQDWAGAGSQWAEAIRGASPDEIAPETRQEALDRFARLLPSTKTGTLEIARLFAQGLPFLLVLDTFEEIQYNERDAVRAVFRFLNELQRKTPQLRVILMGRAPVDDVRDDFVGSEAILVEADTLGTGFVTNFSVISVALGDLSPEAARAYLLPAVNNDTQLADDLVKAIGGSPLSLRLLTRVLEEGQIDLVTLSDEMQSARGSSWLPWRKMPSQALLQGILFQRILGHIHDPKIRDLAHPGLVLRRITPELIKEVLAGPCRLGQLSDAEAGEYFYHLAREVSLVATDWDPQGETVLRHRPELRRIMLRLMEADESKKDQVRQVHENAVRFYEARTGPLAREEALYHRLMLNAPPRPDVLLDDIPTEEAVQAGYARRPLADDDPRPIWRGLAMAVEELPVAAGLYLDARLQGDLIPGAEWQAADPQDRELVILGRVSRRAREHDSLVAAIEALRRDQAAMSLRPGRSPLSPLPLIEIALLERKDQLDSYEEAYKLAEQAISRQTRARRSDRSQRRLVECSLLGARLAARLGQAERCAQLLAEAQAASHELPTYGAQGAGYARRCERQLLRFAADCYSIAPTVQLWEIFASALLQIAQTESGLADYPALARYAVAAAFSDQSLPVHSLPRYGELLDRVRTMPLLAVLVRRMPQRATQRVAEVLAEWLAELIGSGADGNRFAGVIKLPADVRDRERLRSAWQAALRSPSRQFAEQLAQLFEAVPIRPERLVELCRALVPTVEDRTTEEDPVEEARRAGDLIPGEGRHSAQRQRLKQR